MGPIATKAAERRRLSDRIAQSHVRPETARGRDRSNVALFEALIPSPGAREESVFG
jgi:hypothetical protein